MKIVVVGGSGLVGSKLVDRLALRGHQVVAASRRTGVDAVTGQGLDAALEGAQVVVDVSNAPSFEDPAVTEFFRRATTQLLQAGARAGVAHHLALSVVGAARLPDSAYFRAKQVQEGLLRQAPLPATLVQATQFFEFMANIIPPGSGREAVRLSPARVQPVAANDVADLLAVLAEGPPSPDIVQMAGPESFRLCELVEWVMYSYQDERPVIADPQARYYNARLDDDTLTPRGEAVIGRTLFADWLDGYLSGAIRLPQVHHPDPMAPAQSPRPAQATGAIGH